MKATPHKVHPAAALFPMMQPDEYAALRDDIAVVGQRDPIARLADKVLDGRNRLRACNELGIEPRFVELPADTDPISYVLSLNLHRRHLTPSQRATVAVELEKLYAAAAKERLRTKGGHSGPVNLPEAKGDARDQAGKALGVSGKMVGDAKRLKETSPETFARVAAGEVKLRTAVQATQRVAREADRQQRAEAIAPAGDDAGVFLGDFRDYAKTIPDGSVNLIFTDPPYNRDSVPLYGDMVEIAARVLMPGGSLITYFGNFALPEFVAQMTPHLRYWYQLFVQQTGPSSRMNEFGVVVHVKPLLWFVKGTRHEKDNGSFIDDLIPSEREKGVHPWQQSTVEARYLIEKLCPPDGIVFDPFCGGGTTAVACKQLGRRFLTCEIDTTSASLARQRISETPGATPTPAAPAAGRGTVAQPKAKAVNRQRVHPAWKDATLKTALNGTKRPFGIKKPRAPRASAHSA